MGASGAPWRTQVLRSRALILVTVGTQLPFPRLVDALDRMAPSLSRRVVAQIADQESPPQNIEWRRSLAPQEFDSLFQQADLVVSHAGIGTVLAAKKYGKPLIVFPRQVRFGEHRNDHQLATAGQLSRQRGIYVASDEIELAELLRRSALERPSPERSPSLVGLQTSIAAFIGQG